MNSFMSSIRNELRNHIDKQMSRPLTQKDINALKKAVETLKEEKQDGAI